MMADHWKRMTGACALLGVLTLMGFLVEGEASEFTLPECSAFSGLVCLTPLEPGFTCEDVGAYHCFHHRGAPFPPECDLVTITCGMSEECQDPSHIPLECEFGPGVHN